MPVKSEIELAAQVVTWLVDLKYEVYQEVQFELYGRVADIVAVQGNILWVIEAKKSMTFKVIEQAEYWKSFAHYSAVAVPSSRRKLAPRVCEWLGIGVLEVGCNVFETVPPRLNRNALTHYLRDCLSPELKTYAMAGSQSGHWTPFKSTCDNIREKVNKKPGITMKELMDGLNHHYASSASARSAIGRWAAEGIIQGVRVERDGRYLKFYPELESGEVINGR